MTLIKNASNAEGGGEVAKDVEKGSILRQVSVKFHSKRHSAIAVNEERVDYSKKKLKVWTSFTLQNVVAIDFANATCTMQSEIDLKYKVKDFAACFPYMIEEIFADQGQVGGECTVKADEIAFPYKVNNATDKNVLKETHFFKTKRVSEKEPEADTPPSMYPRDNGYPIEDTSLRLRMKKGVVLGDESGHITTWKCEKYSLIISCAYFQMMEYIPIHDIFIMLKLGSDGRPGTENAAYIEDNKDNSFPGVSDKTHVFGYEVMAFPDGKKHKIELLDVAHDYKSSNEQRKKTEWTRLYLMFHIRGISAATIAKYFFVPPMMITLVFISGTQNAFGPDQKEALLGNTVGIFLAHIALIIFNKGHSPKPTGGEIAVLINTVYLCVATLCVYYNEQMVSPSSFISIIIVDWVIIFGYFSWLWFAAKKKVDLITHASLRDPSGFALL